MYGIARHLLFYVYPILATTIVCGSTELKTDSFLLKFGNDGRPAEFSTLPENKSLLSKHNPGAGFYVQGPDRKRTSLKRVSVNPDGNLIARSEDGELEVTFKVRVTPRYLAFRIQSVKGIPTIRGTSLNFELNVGKHARVTELDYMTRVRNLGYSTRVNWDSIWYRTKANPLGGFALFVANDEKQADDTLLRIWVYEKLPHPKVDGAWTLERSRSWVADWQKRFADRSQLVAEGESIADLDALLPYAERADIKEIYLFTNTWRTDPFWPRTQPSWHVNRKVFPRGEEDLLAFSEKLAKKGMRLNLHYVSGGIGPQDPVYVGSKPDRRLATWVSGTLVKAADPKTNDLVFKPSEPTAYPPGFRDFFRHDHVRIEDEIIRVRSFEPSKTGTWLLKNCQRGQFLTKAATHEAGAETVGLIVPYGQNYVPDNDSNLLDEIAENYAGLINRCKIGHTEYDGAEIHAYNGRWGYLKFATKVYQNLDHPVTAHDSSGSAPRCYFEYRLHSTKQLLRGSCRFTHGNWCAPIALASPSRPASTILDAHFVLSQGHLGGALGITKPEPMFGVTEKMLKAHGLTDAFIRAIRDWKKLSGLLTDEQRKQIDDSLSRPKRPTPQASHHAASQVVHVPRMKKDGVYAVIPMRVLTRKSGDIPWRQGQEHGAIGPRQFVKPGDKISLENPNTPQPAQFVIRVLYAFEPKSPAVKPAEAKPPSTTIRPEDLFTATNEDAAARRAAGPNVDLQVPLKRMRTNGKESAVTQVTEGEDGVLRLQAENRTAKPAWAFEALPSWGCRFDMTTRRGIGMTVTGDGSGAFLLFQIPGRDYVVPIDFKGEKYIEIPHGEVAWADSRWGWRMKTKRTNYARVGWCKLGFGYLPPKSKASVTVRDLKALAEIPAALTNPVIRVGNGSLNLKGRVFSSQILVWQGGDNAIVYDENWKKLRELPTERKDYVMPKGFSTISVHADESNAKPWLEVQFMTEGEEMLVPVE